MKRTVLLGLVWITTTASATVVVDLTGQWRFTSQAGVTDFAAPSFDDTGWGVLTLQPSGRRPLSGWARRRVELPEEAGREPLALTFGTFWRSYEVYIDGELIGTNGGFPLGWTMEVPRSRTFPIPTGLTAAKRSIVIAVRFRRASMPPDFRVPDDGQYVLTAASTLPVDLGLQSLYKRRLEHAPEFAFGILFLVFGFLSALAWRADPVRREFLWFALVCAVRAAHSFYSLYMLAPDARPFNDSGLAALDAVIMSPAHPLYIEFVMAALGSGWRWIRPVIWSGCLFAGYRVYFDSAIRDNLAYSMATGALALTLIAVHAWRTGRTASFPDRAFLVLLALPPLNQLEAWSRQVLGVSLDFATSYQLGEYQVNRQSIAFVMVCVAILGLLLRRVAADLRERQRLAGELQAGRYVQQFLLGAGAGTAEVVYEPSEEVGGDFYHVAELAGGAQLLVVGDVSGKGLKAAFVVSMITGALRNRRTDEPAALLEELNRVLAGGAGFVTAVAVKVESNGLVVLASAGNPAPYLAGSEVELPPGLPLGIDREACYQQRQLRLAPGQSLTFVSDGVVEAANAKGELFGFERMREISGKSSKEIAETAKAWGQNDDITVVTVRRLA